MSSITTAINHLTRSLVWSEELKEIVLDELTGQGHVRWIPFANGETLNIPSIGESTVRNYVEDTAAKYDSLDTGNFTFNITEYLQSGLYIKAGKGVECCTHYFLYSITDVTQFRIAV